MKNRMFLLGTLLVLIIVGVTFGIYLRGSAQPDIVSYLEEQFKQQNVPVVEITVLEQSPMHLQVIIQSKSNGEKAMPEDPINLGLVAREVSLASQLGYSVDRITIILLDNQGKPMGTTDEFVDRENISLNLSAATMDNNAAKDLIRNRINLYGMSITGIDIKSSNGLQFLVLQLSTPSIKEANQIIVSFMDSLHPLLGDVNAQGAQIAMLKLELKDEKDNILLNYLIDLQTHSENGWMADGLAFPQPPPGP